MKLLYFLLFLLPISLFAQRTPQPTYFVTDTTGKDIYSTLPTVPQYLRGAGQNAVGAGVCFGLAIIVPNAIPAERNELRIGTSVGLGLIGAGFMIGAASKLINASHKMEVVQIVPTVGGAVIMW